MGPIFARIEGGEHGVGKVIERRSGHCQVEFFESPSGPALHTLSAPEQHIVPVVLSEQTRVFWQDPRTSWWWAGRVHGGCVDAAAIGRAEDHYSVRFPNGRDELVPISALYVRWAHPVADPTDYLAARITDTPFFFEGRSHIVRHLAAQRAAFGGLSGLASAAIDLLEHQVTTVRRVLADPLQRYLLADEVGLGKTIEAGVLIRQHVIDLKDQARVLILAPPHLVPQWREELAHKFYVGELERVNVAHEADLVDVPIERVKLTMLVVDEAHHSALNAFAPDPQRRAFYQRLSALAQSTPRLLLLSATPVLHQEDGFLAMLHLLDPHAYPLTDQAGFRRRIADRQRIADATADLTDDASSFPAQEALEGIEHLKADDARLAMLWQDVHARVYDDETDPDRMRALRRLRSHLRETYRLHRRLLRTRREDRRVQALLPARNGALVISHLDAVRAEGSDFLETWRLECLAGGAANDKAYEKLFTIFVEAALSHPRLLLEVIKRRLAQGERQHDPAETERDEVLALPWAFAGEENLLEDRRRILDAVIAEEEPRALRLIEYLREHDEITKFILFVSDASITANVMRPLTQALGARAVVLQGEDHDSVRRFQRDPQVRVLVCDESAEEGLNLQGVSATVVHYDLPLSPARIEQRIGRVDRLEARGRLRNLVFSSDCSYENAWLNCLTQAIRVFHRSVAPLQYVLAESTARLRGSLLHEGASAVAAEARLLSDAKSGLDIQLRRIRSQEGVDQMEADPEQDAAFFRTLLQMDDEVEEQGDAAMDAWVVERLAFQRRDAGKGAFRFVHDLRTPTLLPLMETLRCFKHCIEHQADGRQRASEIPLRAATFSRATAEKSTAGLMRLGHPFVTALEALVRADDRGMTHVMWRQVPEFTLEPQLFFRFDFVIDTDVRAALSTLGAGFSTQAITRRADAAFPVCYHTVWLDRDLREVAETAMLALLSAPYQPQARAGGRDINVRRERWAQVDQALGLEDWDGLCRRARRRAEQLVRESAAFVERCRTHAVTLRQSAAEVAESLQSRLARLQGSVRESEQRMAQFESHLTEALASGIESPVLRVDSAGATIIARRALAE